MISRRLVYRQTDTEVIIRPWVDTTHLVGGIETPYYYRCVVYASFSSNKNATYMRVYQRQNLNNTSQMTSWVVLGGSSGIYTKDTLYSREVDTVRSVTAPSTITQFKISFTIGGNEYFSDVLTVCNDYDGNVYNLTKIGSQWWTCEDMRAIHYADGTAIVNGGTSSSSTTPYYYEYVQNGENLFEKAPLLGRLYNWPAATKSSDGSSDVNIQGLAPTGFHIPSDSEWQTMINTVSNGDTKYAARLCDDRYYKQFPTQGLDYNQYYKWTTSSNIEACGNYNTEDRNNSNFSVLPSGRFGDSGFYNFGYNTYFLSATPNGSIYAYYRFFSYYNDYVSRNYANRNSGFSVRCICNYDLDTL